MVGLRETFNSGSSTLPLQDMIERMLFAEAIETQKCIDEGVITSSADCNIDSIFGIGFPPWTGGTVQYVLGYPGGGRPGLSHAPRSWPSPTATGSCHGVV